MPLSGGAAAVLDCLRAMRRPGESYSDVILRIAGASLHRERREGGQKLVFAGHAKSDQCAYGRCPLV
jgi:hypothetical protein